MIDIAGIQRIIVFLAKHDFEAAAAFHFWHSALQNERGVLKGDKNPTIIIKSDMTEVLVIMNSTKELKKMLHCFGDIKV